MTTFVIENEPPNYLGVPIYEAHIEDDFPGHTKAHLLNIILFNLYAFTVDLFARYRSSISKAGSCK
jgi:hypothetical protein